MRSALAPSLLGVVPALLAGCRPAPPAPATAPSGALTTPHFTLAFPGEPESVAEAVGARAEEAYARLHALLGAARMPAGRLSLRLAGEGGPGQYPTVDAKTGEILLFRYPGPGGGYEASLAHELVHALRWSLWTDPARQTDAFLFLEEGFAEILAAEAGFPSGGFPTFGFPAAVAAGAWLKSGRDLPIPELVRRHTALNFRCMAQAYPLRLSFMSYLRQRFGLAPLIALAYAEAPLRPEDLERAFGAGLAALAADWRAWALREHEAVADADAQAKAYLERTPIRYFDVCGADVLTP
jgi:hypothetical protein